MYAKLNENGTLQLAPETLRIVVVNPTPERLMFEGYKEVVEAECPTYDYETETVEKVYVEEDGKIVAKYIVFKLPLGEE